MHTQPNSHVTRLLRAWSDGNQAALNDLMPIVYEELKKLARRNLRSERSGHTLQTTALIHELYVRFVEQNMPEWQGRAQFFGVAARLMRQILIDHARRRSAARRGGPEATRLVLEEFSAFTMDHAEDLLAFDTALRKLAELDERKSRIVEMRSFGGMTVEETAKALEISEPTVKREMRLAKAWLKRELHINQSDA